MPKGPSSGQIGKTTTKKCMESEKVFSQCVIFFNILYIYYFIKFKNIAQNKHFPI